MTELNPAKNRDGEAGEVKLRFDEKIVSFADWVEASDNGRVS